MARNEKTLTITRGDPLWGRLKAAEQRNDEAEKSFDAHSLAFQEALKKKAKVLMAANGELAALLMQAKAKHGFANNAPVKIADETAGENN